MNEDPRPQKGKKKLTAPERWAEAQADVRLSTRSVLRTIASLQHPSGQGCFASQEDIAERSGCSLRTYRRVIRVLLDLGKVRKGLNKRGGRSYWVCMDAKPAAQAERPATACDGQNGRPPGQNGTHTSMPTSNKDNTPFGGEARERATTTREEPVEEPKKAELETSRRPNSKRARRGASGFTGTARIPIPDDWQPGPSVHRYAQERGWSWTWVTVRERTFIAHHRGEGTRKADWDWTFIRWLLGDEERDRQRAEQAAQGPAQAPKTVLGMIWAAKQREAIDGR